MAAIFDADADADADAEAGAGARIVVWLELPGVAVPAQLESEVTLVHAGRVIDRFRVSRKVTAEGPAIRARKVKIYGDLMAPSGSYELRLSASVGEARAEHRYPLEVPSSDGGLRVLPPFFIDDLGESAVVYEDSKSAEESGETGSLTPPADYPLVISVDESFVPEIAPRVDDDTPRSRVCVMGYRLTAATTLLDANLVDADGALLSKERFQLTGSDEATEPGGLDRLYFGLDTQHLPAGDYQLTVSAHDLSTDTKDRSAMPFRVER